MKLKSVKERHKLTESCVRIQLHIGYITYKTYIEAMHGIKDHTIRIVCSNLSESIYVNIAQKIY